LEEKLEKIILHIYKGTFNATHHGDLADVNESLDSLEPTLKKLKAPVYKTNNIAQKRVVGWSLDPSHTREKEMICWKLNVLSTKVKALQIWLSYTLTLSSNTPEELSWQQICSWVHETGELKSFTSTDLLKQENQNLLMTKVWHLLEDLHVGFQTLHYNGSMAGCQDVKGLLSMTLMDLPNSLSFYDYLTDIQ
jgi:hypothetical protein